MTRPCTKAKTLFSPSLDDRLNDGDRRFLEDHLAYCKKCAAHFHDLRASLGRAQLLDVIEPDADFEESVLRALPPLDESLRFVRRDAAPRSGRRWLSMAGVGLASAAALLLGFFLRSVIPFGSTPVANPTASKVSDGLQRLASDLRDPDTFQREFVNHLDRTQDVFTQLASFKGRNPQTEARLIEHELEASGIEPRTRIFLDALPGLTLEKKSDVQNYLANAESVVHLVRTEVSCPDVTPRVVHRVREVVDGSGLLDLGPALRQVFVTTLKAPTVQMLDRKQNRGVWIAHEDAEIDEFVIYSKARRHYFDGEFLLAYDLFEEFPRLFPKSAMGQDASYWSLMSAMKVGDPALYRKASPEAVRRMRSAVVDGDRMGRNIWEWNSAFGEMTLDIEVRTEGGRTTIREKHLGTADGQFVVSLKERPGTHEVMVLCDESKLGNLRTLAECYPKAVRIDPSHLSGNKHKHASAICIINTRAAGQLKDDRKFQETLKNVGLKWVFQFSSDTRK